MKHWLILIGIGLTVGCTTAPDSQNNSKPPDKQKDKNIPLDQKVRRHIQSSLKLTAADSYELAQFSQDLNDDDSLDVIFTVNLMDRALKESIQSGRPEKYAEMGYMGYYNYIFFMDGKTKKISEPFVVPSSPMFPLEINFTKILGTANVDFTVDYRVRNMQRRRFCTIENGKPKEVCQAVIFDGLGTSQRLAYDIQLEESQLTAFNDIVEYEAILEPIIIPNMDSTYTYKPSITPTKKEVRRWYYSASQGKYFTQVQN